MRGIPSLITDIRKKVFTEVARMAYEGNGYEKVDELPYIIVPGDQPMHRESVFLERAIASERVRLAMGRNMTSKNSTYSQYTKAQQRGKRSNAIINDYGEQYAPHFLII